MKDNKYWILHYINAHRNIEEQITVENAKGRCSTEERLFMYKAWGEEKVDEIFGEPSEVEKVKMLLLEIESGKITKEKKYENIISISYGISNICEGELVGENKNLEKYALLYTNIPIKLLEPLLEESLAFPFLENGIAKVTAKQLDIAKNWLNHFENGEETNLPKKAFFEYVFELAYISLKEIFEEIKNGIM